MEINKKFKLTVEEYLSLGAALSWYNDNRDYFEKIGWSDLDLYDIIERVINDCEIYKDDYQLSKEDGDFDWDNLIQEIQDGNI